MDRLTGLAVFAKVVDAGSFSAAARHFAMSPAMVTAHVQTLDDRLGVRLLNRTTRRVSATEVGQNFYERCLHILSELEEAEGIAGESQSIPRGLLRVTAPVSFGTRQLAPAIADYLVAYPDISIELSLDDPYLDLIEKRFDLAIRLGQLADSSLIARKLCTLTTILSASPGYLEKNGAPRIPRDLIGHNCLVYTYAEPLGVWNFVGQDGRKDIVRVSGRFLANSGDVLLALVVKGGGVALAPDYLVEGDLKAGRLIRLLPKYATPETAVQAVYPHARHLSAKTRTFIDFLASRSAGSHQVKRDGVAEAGSLRRAVEKRLPSPATQWR